MRPSKLGITRTGNAPHWNGHCLDGDMSGAVDSSVEAFSLPDVQTRRMSPSIGLQMIAL